ncbi:MAG: restriction endonuclease subunit S [Verrucomicrobiota bacterium]
MSFPRYPKYKDSGVEWLGQVPEHWSVKRIGYYFNERREKVSDKDFPALSVTKNGIVPQLDTAAKSDDGDNRKKVLKGDFVINSRSDRKGSSGASDLDGSVSLICTVMRPQEQVHTPFVHHLLRSQPFQEEFYRNGKGIVADLWSTNYSEMRNIVLGMPPMSEQARIAEFLDQETAKIDALVAEQERLMALLKEKRQAVISHAVTKGLNPKAAMKPSGIEWLGDVPAHWEVKPLKYSITKIEQGWSPQCESDPAEPNKWGVLKVGCGNRDEFDPTEQKALPLDIEPQPNYEIKAGDILMSRGNTLELVGMATFVRQVRPHLLLSDLLYRFHAKPERAESEFLVFSLRSPNVRFQIERDAVGASHTMKKIGQGTIREFVIALPPLIEQRAIIEFTRKEISGLDTLTAEAQRAIDLLQERRTALISAAVTGQIDVRRA